MDSFAYMQIVSRIEHYESIAQQVAGERRHALSARKIKPPKRLTPKGRRSIVILVRKNAST